ncbi:MAG TPA: cytochrome c [Myxococcota bacterium]
MLKLSRLALIAAITLSATVACSDDKKADAPAVDATSTTKPDATPPPAKVEEKKADATTDKGLPTPEAASAGVGAGAGAAEAEAITIFNTRCAACHGVNGKGDGLAAAALNPKPRDYSDKAWQASVDDNYIAKVIVEGGAAVGKSPLMAANADLKDKPDVVKALVAKIRTFGK